MFFNISINTARRDFARSILEGNAMEISKNIDVMHDRLGQIKFISVSGGLTQSRLFNQIQANVYKSEIEIYSPLAKNLEIYSNLKVRRQRLYDVLKQGGIYQTL
jgi:sugar (pentulose or hexulose) kinase